MAPRRQIVCGGDQTLHRLAVSTLGCCFGVRGSPHRNAGCPGESVIDPKLELARSRIGRDQDDGIAVAHEFTNDLGVIPMPVEVGLPEHDPPDLGVRRSLINVGEPITRTPAEVERPVGEVENTFIVSGVLRLARLPCRDTR